MNKVYYTPQINYILWGRINRLLSDDGWGFPGPAFPGQFFKVSYEQTIAAVRVHRTFKQNFDKYRIEGCVEWAKVGWNWTGRFTDVPADSLPLRPNPRRYTGRVGFRVGCKPELGQGREDDMDAILAVT